MTVPLIPNVTLNENEILGSGAYGTVYGGNLGTNRVALKTFNNILINPEQVIAAIQAEGELWFALKHPNIAMLWGIALTSKGEPMLVVNRLEMNLLTRLHTGQVPTNQERTKWLLEIALAFQYLHSFNPPVLHRDLKPDNILLDGHGKAVLTDFGLSRVQTLYHTYSNGRSRQGQFLYAPPESYIRGYTTAPQYDVYSYGMVMYEVWTGQRPFAEHDLRYPQKVIDLVMRGERPQRTSDIPDQVWNLIERCWAHDLKQRPTFEAIEKEIQTWKFDAPAPIPAPIPAQTQAQTSAQAAISQTQPPVSTPRNEISVASLAASLFSAGPSLPSSSEHERLRGDFTTKK
ncbi:kinase-like protein [Rhizoclosmatium globosum]|uniref:Kinase-like protein n=1 Tax=Rhizoclosmatium globosum TaxID=329046 RepID=A0A1Y2BS32_9FUNG|nr:kinase-like protein [Rhizoclosmatium globosum]|eukprot:ORY37568.1 kinase-like protein [Rhizoclosmatium globosum]